MAFYLLVSFFPFLIFIITFISYMPAINIYRNVSAFSNIMPESAYSVVIYTIQKAISEKSIRLLVFSFGITLWSSSGVIMAFIKGINKAYDQEENRSRWSLIAISLAFTIELMILIVFSMALLIFGRRLGGFIFNYFNFKGLFLYFWNSLRYVIAFITIVSIFASLYVFAPNCHKTFKEVLPGAVLATVGWTITSLAFSFYANSFANYSIIYGSIGGIIALLTWIYLSSIVMLLGAEINASLNFMREGKSRREFKRY